MNHYDNINQDAEVNSEEEAAAEVEEQQPKITGISRMRATKEKRMTRTYAGSDSGISVENGIRQGSGSN